MSLSALTWKYVGSAIPAANTVEGVLNALYTLGTSATYYDASARTPGAGQAGTWSRYQNAGQTEAVYMTPASNAFALRHIWAGDDAAHAPTMIPSPIDTWATNTVLYGIARYAGAYNAWDNVAPFTSGSFTGYSRACALGTFTIAKVHLFECNVGVYIIFATTTGSIHCCGGELIDPGVTNATSPNCAEATNNSRILMYTNGSTTATSTATWANTSPSLFQHSASVNLQHSFVLTVGSTALVPIQRHQDGYVASTTVTCTNDDGDALFMPIHVNKTSTGSYTMIGRLREMLVGPDSKIGTVASASGVPKAFCAGTHPSTDNDALWLQI